MLHQDSQIRKESVIQDRYPSHFHYADERRFLEVNHLCLRPVLLAVLNSWPALPYSMGLVFPLLI